MALLTKSVSGWRRLVALRRGIAWFLGLVLLCTVSAPAQTAASAEYQLKAAFLYKLLQFVHWPAPAFHEPAGPLVIGVLGEDPFGPYLDELVRGETVDNHPLIVRRYKRPEDIADCHILFVSRSESGTLDKVLAPLRSRSVLTVSDMDAFAQHGGMMRLVTEKGKIRFEINTVSAKTADLTISSKILSLATIVAPDKG